MISFERTLFWDGWFRHYTCDVPEWAQAERMDTSAPLTQLWGHR